MAVIWKGLRVYMLMEGSMKKERTGCGTEGN
jgi:hypothetical protein